MYFEVRAPSGRVLFESLSQDQAIAFAQEIYQKRNVVCDVTEIQHTPGYFQSTVEP